LDVTNSRDIKKLKKHTVVERKENQENSGEGYTTEKDIA
jgi:hypothetical protein